MSKNTDKQKFYKTLNQPMFIERLTSMKVSLNIIFQMRQKENEKIIEIILNSNNENMVEMIQ